MNSKKMQEIQFFRTYLPYCLDRITDTTYQPLDRDYQPLGKPFKFARKLSRIQVMSLSHNKNEDSSRIYLYNDGCKPIHEPEAYMKRLIKLSKYETFTVS